MTTGAQSIERYAFGLEGVAYLRSYLTRNADFGGLLGRLLIRRKLESGSTWAFLPPGTSKRARASFETGGLAPAGDVHPMPGETVFVYIRTDALDAPVIAWATDELESRESVLCVEDAIDRRHHFTGPASARALPTLFCGDHVYCYTHSGGGDLAPVIRAARGASGNRMWE